MVFFKRSNDSKLYAIKHMNGWELSNIKSSQLVLLNPTVKINLEECI